MIRASQCDARAIIRPQELHCNAGKRAWRSCMHARSFLHAAPEPHVRMRRDMGRWRLAAIGLSVSYAVALAMTAPDMGYTRDEGYYFKAAKEYSGWWDTLFSSRFAKAFTDEEIQFHFKYNTEHPPLVKLTLGFTYRVLHSWLDVAGPGQAYRFTGFIFAALSLFAAFLLGRDLVSERVGLTAMILMATIPRYFYDAHLACFDVPMTAMWTLSLWTVWRAMTAPKELVWRRSVVAGIIFGLALATKLNALFMPGIFILVWLHHTGGLRTFKMVPGPSGGVDLALPKIPLVLFTCALIGPVVFFVLWPHLWHDPFTRIGGYIGFHLSHEHYPIRFFDTVYVKPPFPWHFAWTMSAMTLPSPLLVLGAIGLLVTFSRAFRARSSGDFLLLLAAIVPIALISMPNTPIFGGVKHWYNSMPALCVVAARALFDAVEVLPKMKRIAAPALIGLAALPGFLGIVASHPNGIGYYNELAGGFRGAAEIGMQRSFWGGVSKPLLEDVAQLPPGTRVFWDHTNWDVYSMYQREKLIPPGIGFANKPEEADAATLFEDREGHPISEEAAWARVGLKPKSGVYVDEVPLVQFYDRPARR
jgi:4-amino-4-deoxy-L-arabinose transferase-like glycosyltransferase